MSAEPETNGGERFPTILAPFALRGMQLPNRIVVPAMVTRLCGEDGFVNDDITARYLRYASGGVGLIVVEAMAVHSARSGPLLRLSDNRFIPGLAEMAARVHATSESRIVPQIIHFLKVARSGWRQRIKDLSREDLATIVRDYGEAAARARSAGFDGVELHMAHAYTLSSFLSRRNRRRDEYGRTLENRLRLPSEVIVEVRRCVGDDFAVGVRFDAEECIKDGYTTQDAREMALRMARLGVDWLSLSAGGKFEDAVHKPGQPLYPYTGYSGDRCMPSAAYPDGAHLHLAEEIKRWLVAHDMHTPIIATGKIATPEMAEWVLTTGKADLVGMARQLLADPDWVRKVREGRPERIVRCVYGNVCKNLDENFKRVTCTLWPRGALQAPLSADRGAPRWPDEGSGFRASDDGGRIKLAWTAAVDDEAVYGYEIWRAEGALDLVHRTSVRGVSTHWFDEEVVADAAYRYRVRAYDLAGNRSPFTETVTTRLATASAIVAPGPAGAPRKEPTHAARE